MKKITLVLGLIPGLFYAQEPAKDPVLEKILQQVTKAYYRTKAPGYFVPEFSVSTRFEGISLFGKGGNFTLGGAQTMVDIKLWRYMAFGAFRFTLSTPLSTGGSHGIAYLRNKKLRLGLYGGGGGTVLDTRPGETGKGSALSIALFGGGEFLDGGSAGGLEFNLRYQYNFHRYFALTTGFDLGWKIFRIDGHNFGSVNGLVYGWTLGLAF